MKFLKPSSLLILSLAVGCSMMPKQQITTTTVNSYRHFAGVNEVLSDRTKLQERVQKLMDGIFHSYLMGQVYLQDFDKQLDKRSRNVMKSLTYSRLLAVRNYVDIFEHDFNN